MGSNSEIEPVETSIEEINIKSTDMSFSTLDTNAQKKDKRIQQTKDK
jgi:hypothetical protein